MNRTATLALACVLLSLAALAADKSGVSPTKVSLPKGPGSIEGLGEAFQPTLNTGTAKYAVKLTVPRERPARPEPRPRLRRRLREWAPGLWMEPPAPLRPAPNRQGDPPIRRRAERDGR